MTSAQMDSVADIPARGDRLIDASIGDATNLIPMIAGDASSHAIAGQLYLPLLKYDKDLNLVGRLAQSWEVSADNKTITFHLHQGLKWTDGKSFTSADCIFTLKLIQEEKATHVSIVPTHLIAMLAVPDVDKYDVSSLKYMWYGGSPMPLEVLRKGLATFGPVFGQGYGQSESGPAICHLPKEDHNV